MLMEAPMSSITMAVVAEASRAMPGRFFRLISR